MWKQSKLAEEEDKEMHLEQILFSCSGIFFSAHTGKWLGCS